VIVDCPPRLGSETLAAMTQATLLLMPLAPLPLDAWALPETLGILAHAQGVNPGVTVRALLNRAGRSLIEGDVGRQIELLGVELCATILRQRIAHSAAMVRGRAVVEYAPSSEAAVEARRLAREIRPWLKLDEGSEKILLLRDRREVAS
jgi:cellulose biosynthesis protein BcsQ